MPGEAPSCAPYATPELKRTLQHTVWFLPDIAACRAMRAMLEDHPFFGGYDVILAAGGNKSGLAALGPVSTAIGDGTKTKTITLTCGKLLTGVTVPQWGGIFMLRNLKAAEVHSFLNFLPVLCYEDGKMVRLNENALLDYAYSGIGAAMLAKRWQSPRLVNLDRDTLANLLENQSLCDALANIEAFRGLRDHARKVVNADDTLRKLRREGKKPGKAEQNDARKRHLELREKLLQFLCKVPLFMYLTDFREESLRDVIRRIETALFVKVTGLEIEHFDELCRVGVFNERFLNTSIYAFRRQEAVHLIEPGG